MARQYDNRGRDQINIESGNVLIKNQSSRNQNEQLILKKVKWEVDLRLEDSLHNRIFLNLEKQSCPQQVKRIWGAEVKIGTKPAAPISSGTSIVEVFERPDIAGHLMILGDLGAGKTTTMLDLAKALIEKAEKESDEPIPVIVNLSGWDNLRQPMSDWLLQELNSKYKISEDTFRKCLDKKRLLPMLDGLDEVQPNLQESCVDAINRWLQGSLCPQFIVVCSRQEEYTNYQAKLNLNGAVLLQSLTDAQIKKYLFDIDQNELWELLQDNAELLELARTPFLLSITILSYDQTSLNEWHQLNSKKQLLKSLLDNYIRAMFSREMKNISYRNHKLPLEKQTKYWLKLLALRMKQESQTEFLIEKMKPSLWLLGKSKTTYRLIIGIILGTLLLPHGIIMFYTVGGTIFAIMFGLSGGIFGIEQEVKIVETFIWSFKRAKKILVNRLTGCMAFPIFFVCIAFGVIAGVINLKYGIVYGIVYGFGSALFLILLCLLVGLITGLFVAVVIGWQGLEIDIKSIPNQGIRKSASNAFFTSVLCILAFGLFGLTMGYLGGIFLGEIFDKLSFGTAVGLFYGLFFGILVGMEFGGLACIQHFFLRGILFCNGSMPWNYARFLNYCTERQFLQRVGGRYRFIHRLLQEHFSEMEI